MFCFQQSPSFDTWCEFHIIFFRKKNLAKGNAYNPHYKKNMFLVENCFFLEIWQEDCLSKLEENRGTCMSCPT
jgi:hypothetical protein